RSSSRTSPTRRYATTSPTGFQMPPKVATVLASRGDRFETGKAAATRPAVFLDWVYRAGLLRRSGTALQFRHRILQQWLERRPSLLPPKPNHPPNQTDRPPPRNRFGAPPPPLMACMHLAEVASSHRPTAGAANRTTHD